MRGEVPEALLQQQRLAIARTHNLEALAKSLLTAHTSLGTLDTALRTLGAYAVETRYPGKSADRALAKEALALCTEIRRVCRRELRTKKPRRASGGLRRP
jgi:hypothetical protein